MPGTIWPPKVLRCTPWRARRARPRNIPRGVCCCAHRGAHGERVLRSLLRTPGRAASASLCCQSGLGRKAALVRVRVRVRAPTHARGPAGASALVPQNTGCHLRWVVRPRNLFRKSRLRRPLSQCGEKDLKVQWRADRLRVQIFSAGSRQGDLKSNFRQKLPDWYEISRKAKIGF